MNKITSAPGFVVCYPGSVQQEPEPDPEQGSGHIGIQQGMQLVATRVARAKNHLNRLRVAFDAGWDHVGQVQAGWYVWVKNPPAPVLMKVPNLVGPDSNGDHMVVVVPLADVVAVERRD